MSEHPGPLLSALVDGDLGAAERAAVEEHLATCEACRREVHAVALLREAVAGLPPVEPPGWFLPGVLEDGPQPHHRRVRRFRFGVANVAATAAAWMVVVGATGQAAIPAAAPDLAGLAAAHRLAASETLSPAPAGSMAAPAELGPGYELAGYREVDGATQAVYRAGDRWLSLFAQPGRLDRDALPADARPVDPTGTGAWEVDPGVGEAVVLDRGDAVLVLVGGDGAATVAVPDGVTMEPPPDGIVDRLVEAGAGLLRAFSLAG